MNRLNDRLLRNASVNTARKYGVTAQGLKKTKNKMKDASGEAARAQDYYNRLINGGLTNDEMNDLISSGGAVFNASTGKYEITEAERMRAFRDSADKADAADKAKKKYEEGKKYGETHRVNLNFEEEHRRSFREMLPGSESRTKREDMYTATRKNTGTAHQKMGDRLLGAHDKWNDPTSERKDNRWDPTGQSIQDRPNSGRGETGWGEIPQVPNDRQPPSGTH